MPKPILPSVSFADLKFPRNGLDLSRGFTTQRPGTTRIGANVRTYEPGSMRARGGQRPGLSKYISSSIGDVVQELNVLVGTTSTSGSTNVQTSQSGRVVNVVAVSQGKVFVANAGNTAWTEATNTTSSTPPLNSTGVVYSASNNQALWFVDGTHYCYFDPADTTVKPWTASGGGTLPRDVDNNAPRLICTWRGRTVLAGLLGDPQDWFMSAVGDPTNWNYSPDSPTPTQAIAGINAPQGLVGDVITALVPYTDDVLIMGGDHSIWMFRGDPLSGGQIDLVTNAIGMAWGAAWTSDPYGTIYFVSNLTGIYTLVPGQAPHRISQPIEQLLLPLDTGSNTIRLMWDDRFQGLHVFVTPTGQSQATTHFFYEQRVGAWWTDSFANADHNPLCCTTFDGNNPGDRVSLIGSWDGYVRAISPTATDDDGEDIASEVWLGPFTSKTLDEFMLEELVAVLGSASGDVTWGIYVGETAEEALSSSPVMTGTWSAGRNLADYVRRAGHAVYVRITSTNAWALESIRARISTKGKVRSRSR